MSAQRRALVIGGSIGGLFAANWLRAIGWDVTVFERVGDDLASRGAGIGTHEELRAVIQRLGLTVDETIGVWVHTRVCLERDGSVSHRLATSHLQSSWARVYRLLKDAFPAGNYRFGMALERIEQDAAGVTAIFADGSRARGDLLVGADGVYSTVRGLLLPEAQPRYAGYVAWRALEGPKFLVHCQRSLRDSKHAVPASINGVTREQLGDAMFDLYARYGSRELRRDVERHRAWAMKNLPELYVIDDIAALVLGAAPSGKPGPLVAHFTGNDSGKLPVPVMIIPGGLNDDQLEALS